MYARLTRIGSLIPAPIQKFWRLPVMLTLSASSMAYAMAECDNKGCRGVTPRDMEECQNLIMRWFYNWDQMVMENNDENKDKYSEFISNNFDDECVLTVNGVDEGWTDIHHKDDDWMEFQQGMAEGFCSSYSVVSPLCFISYKYCDVTGNKYATFNGTALGNMGVRNRKSPRKSKMMTTHQKYNTTFIKRPDVPKWKLYREESWVVVLELADSPNN
eukprot:43783_1